MFVWDSGVCFRSKRKWRCWEEEEEEEDGEEEEEEMREATREKRENETVESFQHVGKRRSRERIKRQLWSRSLECKRSIVSRSLLTANDENKSQKERKRILPFAVATTHDPLLGNGSL